MLRNSTSSRPLVGRHALLAVVLMWPLVPANGQAGVASQDIPASLHGDSLGDGGPALRARLVTPVGLARDSQGNLYIAERGAHRIRRVDGRTGTITTFAGTGQAGYAGDGGPATAARLTQPDAIVIDRDGHVVFTDVFNHRVRRVDPRSGIITTIAGTGDPGFSGDGGLATQARFNGPFGISLDPAGTLYIADTENQRIRRIDARTGIVTTVAGNGIWDFAGDGGQAIDASFARPHLVLAEGDSALLIGDSFNFRVRRLDLRTGIIRTIVGTGERGSGGDGGPATAAAITYMGGLALLPNGDLLVSSLAEHRIRRVDRRSGTITTIAGTGRWTYDGDGRPATTASLHLPTVMLVEPSGDILFSDLWNGRVRRIDARTGMIATVVGSAVSPATPAVRWHFHYHRDSLRAVLDQPVRYTADGTASVRVQRDVVYRSDRSRHNRLDVYTPAGSGGSRHPVVLVVPGRNDTEVRLKDTGGFASWGRLLAASGMVAIVMDHSLGTRGRSLALAADDVETALAYVNGSSVSLGVDTSQVCVLAFSTATPLLAALLDAARPSLRCVAGYYPHVDLTREDAFTWLTEPREIRERYSLVRSLSSVRTPTLLVRAGRDQATVTAPLDTLRVHLPGGTTVTVLDHPDGESGFERARDDSTTRDVVRRTLCFLQRSLRVTATPCGPT